MKNKTKTVSLEVSQAELLEIVEHLTSVLSSDIPGGMGIEDPATAIKEWRASRPNFRAGEIAWAKKEGVEVNEDFIKDTIKANDESAVFLERIYPLLQAVG